MSDITTPTLAPEVSYEPCPTFDPDDDAVCTHCGWMLEDHEIPAAA